MLVFFVFCVLIVVVLSGLSRSDPRPDPRSNPKLEVLLFSVS